MAGDAATRETGGTRDATRLKHGGGLIRSARPAAAPNPIEDAMTRTLACLFAATILAGTATAHADGKLARGQYLVGIMDCGGCHTGGALAGAPDPKLRLTGSDVGFGAPGLGIFYPPNLTPDAETGLGTWTEADIVKAIRTGERPDGRELAPMMPWRAYASLTDADAAAVAAYLKSLSPVRHQAPPPTGPDEKAPAPYLGVTMPAS
jgi:mono/diheme cytochrome c family protein